MGNKISFTDTENGPVQEDEVNESQTVKFYCNVPFAIEFEESFNPDHWEENLPDGWQRPVDDLRRFESSPHGNAHRIKIKFNDLPPDGFKYVVFTENGRLDPRVVPPR